LSGPAAFKLHDTFGFPIDLTKEIAAERGVEVDLEGFEKEMSTQRERARASWKGGDDVESARVYRRVLESNGLTEFVGYDYEISDSVLLSMVAEGETLDRAEEGHEVEIFLDKSPFYAESGGQVGDRGVIETETGSAVVDDTRHVIQGLHGHRARVTNGYLAVGQNARTTIDSPRRESIRKSHTGTHVLHWALRDVLGDHAEQAGSLVEPGRLRFDFSHFSQVTSQELAEIELEVNTRLVANSDVTTTLTSKQDAERMGALAFFGDKYGETVRVVKVGEFSTEFCGGTHTSSSGQVGPLVLVAESSIGSNLRRVEALTGLTAYDHLVSIRGALARAGGLLKVSPGDVPDRLEQLLDKVAGLERDLAAIRTKRQGSVAEELAAGADRIDESDLVIAEVGEIDANELRQLALGIRDRLAGSSVVVVGSAAGTKGTLVAVVSKDLIAKGISAADLIGDAARELGGGGSRDPELAQAGGPNGSQLGVALEKARTEASRALAEL